MNEASSNSFCLLQPKISQISKEILWHVNAAAVKSRTENLLEKINFFSDNMLYSAIPRFSDLQLQDQVQVFKKKAYFGTKRHENIVSAGHIP
jgi:hypothetical protein